MKNKKEEISNFITKLDTIDAYCRERAYYHNLLNRIEFSEGQLDQMIHYAAIRKGQEESRSNELSYIANKEIFNEKLDYSKEFNKFNR